MSNRNFLLKGTLLLTLSGFLTKIIGFIYRIFLSQKIGAQGMGIYQLIFPVYTLCYALAVGGIQTAISRLAAAKAALKDEQGARDIFLLSATLATTISILTGFFLYRHANWFAVHLILEAQCTPLLKILAISVPFGVFHSCVNGYYLARKKLSIPAAAQLIEQCFRVAASFLLFSIWSEKGIAITPKLAVFGLLAGELAAWLFTGFMILWDFCKGRYHLTFPAFNLQSPSGKHSSQYRSCAYTRTFTAFRTGQRLCPFHLWRFNGNGAAPYSLSLCRYQCFIHSTPALCGRKSGIGKTRKYSQKYSFIYKILPSFRFFSLSLFLCRRKFTGTFTF